MPRIFSATYQPYTYEELAAPLREATAAHQAVELNFDTLMTDADKMRAFLNEDWLSYKDYKEYVDQLNAAAYDLARNGLTRQNRGNLLQLKRDYNGKIQAINAGILNRQNAIETFNKSAKGQSSRYIGPRPEDYSVDEYMYGNNPFKFGVDGSEIYSYADEQAKASTSRRYQEFTEGGKWRITEVGVDPNTTSMVMDALRTGRNFTDPEYALLALNNPRQFLYMQAVLDDMRNIADDTRQTFGYGQFSEFDDNGNPVWSQNQKRFDAEIYGGLNKGIQYARKSEADPYQEKLFSHNLKMQEKAADFQYDIKKAYISQGLKDGTLAFDENGKIVPVEKPEEYTGFGMNHRTFENPDVINSLSKLGMKKNNDTWEAKSADIVYNGKKIHFNNILEAYNWAHQGDNSNLISKLEELLNLKYSTGNRGGRLSLDDIISRLENALNNRPETRTEISDQYYNAIQQDLDNARRVKQHNSEYQNRKSVLKDAKYFMSDDDYNDIANSFAFDANGTNMSLEDISGRISESGAYSDVFVANDIKTSPTTETSITADGKISYKTDEILQTLKTNAMRSLPNEKFVHLYLMDKRGNVSTKKIKRTDAEKIINNAIESYTTLEGFLAHDGSQLSPESFTPVIMFKDANGDEIGVSMYSVMPETENMYNGFLSALVLPIYDSKNGLMTYNFIDGLFTDGKIRNKWERRISSTLANESRSTYKRQGK